MRSTHVLALSTQNQQWESTGAAFNITRWLVINLTQFDTGEVAQSCMAGHNHLTKSVMGVIVDERIDSL